MVMMGKYAQTYDSDLPLFRGLGLKPFNHNDKSHKQFYVGKVELEEGSWIEISVKCCPAQFWHFKIYSSDSNKFYEIDTGSGSLVDYWESAKKVAWGMFVVKSIKDGDKKWINKKKKS